MHRIILLNLSVDLVYKIIDENFRKQWIEPVRGNWIQKAIDFYQFNAVYGPFVLTSELIVLEAIHS